MYKLENLNKKKVSDLKEIAKGLNIPKAEKLLKSDLVYQILDFQSVLPASNTPEPKKQENQQQQKKFRQRKPKTGNKPFSEKKEETPIAQTEKKEDQQKKAFQPKTEHKQKQHPQQHQNPNQKQERKGHNYNYDFDGIIVAEGVLEIMPDGYGFMRSSDYHYLTSPDDVYISQSQIKLFGLKTGDTVRGAVRPPKEGEKYFPLIKVESINGRDPNVVRDRVPFEHLTPLFPFEKFTLTNNGHSNLSTRILDIFTPIGKGQRGLLVSQPKTG